MSDDFKKIKREKLAPVFFEAGAGLFDCQQFESGLALWLFHLARLGVKGLNPSKIMDVLENRDKKTAGQLIVLLKRHVKVSDGIEEALQEALNARNYLIHRAMTENIEAIIQDETRDEFVKLLRRLRGVVQKGDKALQPFILSFNEKLDGVVQSELEAEVKALFNNRVGGK